jgi:tetratricopeptide (TPR) repeat protein
METKKQTIYLKSEVKPVSAQHKIKSESADEIPPRKKLSKLISEGKMVSLKESEQPFLEEYDRVKLREYEEGEAEPGDLEWTRYADKKDLQPPENKIDLNIIPSEASNLREILEDLRQAEIYNFKGKVNLEKNLSEKAIGDLSNALEINPYYVDALINRGKAYVLKKRYSDALKDFNHALEIDNKQAPIYNYRGEIYLLKKIHDKAIEDFTTAINLSPMYSDAYLNRALAYKASGMKEEAKSDFIQAISSAPNIKSNYYDLTALEALFDE